MISHVLEKLAAGSWKDGRRLLVKSPGGTQGGQGEGGWNICEQEYPGCLLLPGAENNEAFGLAPHYLLLYMCLACALAFWVGASRQAVAHLTVAQNISQPERRRSSLSSRTQLTREERGARAEVSTQTCTGAWVICWASQASFRFFERAADVIHDASCMIRRSKMDYLR